MSIRSEDSIRENSTTETRNTIFGVPVLIVSVTLAIPVIPFIAYLLGPGTIDGLGMWLMGVSGRVWIGGFILLIVLEVVSHAHKTIKHIAAKSGSAPLDSSIELP
ncbi:MAG: hypothetical protein O7G83_19605 [Proteobacteria bacterium]|nr:hypothetical protein [Pseudomonadota bacterium]